MMSKSFKKYVSKYIVLGSSEWAFVEERLERMSLSSRELLLEEGRICRHLYFLEEGLLRYFVWRDGQDITKFFTYGNIFFTSIRSFQKQLPATENIQALEDCQLLCIRFEHLLEIRKAIPQWHLLTAAVISEVQGWTEDLMVALQNETAQERYRRMLNEQSELSNRIPLKYLATFLGIAPESLSRIRRQLAKG
ncbi:MAG: Crp/Fnr family transcriptional regulator [Bacteroidota bacterium]